jgi:predicted esterase
MNRFGWSSRGAQRRGREKFTSLGSIAIAASIWASCAHAPPPPPGTTAKDVVFSEYSPLSRPQEIARRMLTPMSWAALQGKTLPEQEIDLGKETFTYYVPSGAPPPQGWGLLVWIAPWPQAAFPKSWEGPLDKHRIVFVTPAHADNDTKIYDRRMPLALLAYANIARRFPIDPARTYIGGLSGGSRAALMTAIGYPDIFKGAFLNSGSDPIGGDEGIHVPPLELFHQFQHTKLVYSTGEHDEFNLRADNRSRNAMKDFCVFHLAVHVMARKGHELADEVALERALTSLDKPENDDGLAECNEKLDAEVKAKLAAAKTPDERQKLDQEFGGLTAPP